MALIRKLFWVALFVVSTFCFDVLFEHGTTNYMANARADAADLKKMIQAEIAQSRKKPADTKSEDSKTDK